jgi:hypothetical protein
MPKTSVTNLWLDDVQSFAMNHASLLPASGPAAVMVAA